MLPAKYIKVFNGKSSCIAPNSINNATTYKNISVNTHIYTKMETKLHNNKYI